ncbi:MAG TPA: zinc-ribbon domain-containing protein [Polyangiaceae bacterium]|jgi:predicted Zn finger-like uncharacterized protein
MKITCQSCQSKYNVADEKVEGKIVKIRCRKCGATIVVNGTGGAATNGAGGADTTAQQGAVGGDAQWHVNVGDNDQRTLTLSELVDAYNSGVVTQETFIWCDGMDDWRPLAEVDVVVSALHASANQIALGTPGAFEPQGPAAYEGQAAAAPAYEPPPAAQAPAYEAPAAYAAPAPEPKRAAVAKREARARDLFATNAGEELHTSAPAAPHGVVPAGDGGLTGQRNENSVLFSLAVLTKDSDGRPPTVPPTANKEDSGLIDLKALAQKAESMRPMAMGDGDVFHAPLGFSPPPLGAPVGALSSGSDAQPKSKLPLLIGGGAGVLVLLVLGIVIGVRIGGSGPAPVPTVVAATATTPTVEPSATAAPTVTETAASAAPSATVAATSPKKAGPGTWHPGPSTVKPASGSSGGGSSGGATTPTPTPKKSGGDCGCNGDLMCLMKCSTH